MIAMLGLSDAGKSTWLGSLLDGLEDREGPLTLKKHQASFTILDRYRRALLEGRYPAHTTIDDHHPTRFELVWRGEAVDVDISDYSGERVLRLHDRRAHAWDAGWKERAGSTRLAVLLRADSITRLERHAARSEAASHFDAALVPDDAEERRPRHAPTALALIEALQAMRDWRGLGLGQRAEPGAERVALVLTAWDQVGDQDPLPYLERSAPLLASWLQTNLHPADLQVFGLSATGGDLGDPTHAAHVRERGLGEVAWCAVGSPSVQVRDVSLPIQWLLGGS